MDYSPEATIETERLLMRSIQMEDRHSLWENIFCSKEVLTYFIASYTEKEEDVPMERILSYYRENQVYGFSIVEKKSGAVIGLMLQQGSEEKGTVELGYALGPKFQGKGYGTEALRGAIEFCFSQGAKEVTGSFIVENIGSGHIMEKCGMHYVRTAEKELDYHGKLWDVAYYAIGRP